MRPDVGEVELSREPDALPEKERMLAGGVGRRDGPKNSALRERAGGFVFDPRGVLGTHL